MTPLIDKHYVRILAETLDALPELVVRYRIPDHTIVYCNASWAAWYQLDPDEVVGRKLDEFLSEDGMAGLVAQLARLGPNNLVVLDTVVRNAPNTPGRWVEWVDRYMPDSGGDEVLAVGRDVTARQVPRRAWQRARLDFAGWPTNQPMSFFTSSSRRTHTSTTSARRSRASWATHPHSSSTT